LYEFKYELGHEKSGKDIGDGYKLVYDGVDTGRCKHGVDIIVGPRLSPSIIETFIKNERIITCSL
jgi:hypothetical protein